MYPLFVLTQNSLCRVRVQARFYEEAIAFLTLLFCFIFKQNYVEDSHVPAICINSKFIMQGSRASTLLRGDYCFSHLTFFIFKQNYVEDSHVPAICINSKFIMQGSRAITLLQGEYCFFHDTFFCIGTQYSTVQKND
jgi:hypothetical protein